MSTTYTINRYGKILHLEANDPFLLECYQKGIPQEHHMLDWIMANVPQGGLWLDIGSCNAQHAIIFAIQADMVLALEPMPDNYECCQRNIDRNAVLGNKVMPIMVGAGERSEWASAKRGGSGQASQWMLDTALTGDILVLPVDGIVPDSSEVRLIKIDVEGMERSVVSGAMSTIARCRPELFIEAWEEAAMRGIEAMLAPLGYKLIERFNVVPTYHFSASGRYPVTYTPPKP